MDIDPIAILHLLSNAPDLNSELGQDQQLSQSDSSGVNAMPSLPVSSFGSNATMNPQNSGGFVPSTTAQQRLQDLMNSQPQPIQHAGLGKRIGAAFTALGYGPEAGMSYLQAPYNLAENNWKNQVGVAENAARDENTSNQIGRQLAYNQGQNKIAQERIDATNRHNQATEAANAEKLQIANQRAQAYVFKSTHPDWKPQIGADGVLSYFNPQDPTQSVNTGFNTGKMDDYDKINLGIQGRMQEIGAQQAGENYRALNKPGANAKGAHVSRAFTAPDGSAWALMSDGSVQQMKDLPVGSTGVPTASTSTSTETKETVPGTFLGSTTLGKLTGAEPTVKSEKTTTTTKNPGTGPNIAPANIKNNSVPDAKDIPLANRVSGKTQAMVGGQLMTWNGQGWVK